MSLPKEMRATLFLCLLCQTRATYTYIAGYEPQSHVVEHSEIDLDVAAIIDNLPGADDGTPELNDCTGEFCNWSGLDTAKNIWLNGANSAKSSGLRSISGFASGAETKSSGNDPATDVDYRDNKYISVMNSYWKSKGLNEYTWGYDIINAAFNGTTIGEGDNALNFGTVGDNFRREVVQKGIVYLNVMPYVIWEMQDAINDCNFGKLSENADSVHAWDEAVAFYTGSKEGTVRGGASGLSSDSSGELQFMLADKRCTNYGTCSADYDNDHHVGYSEANFDMFQLYSQGRDRILGAVAQNNRNEDVTATCDALYDDMDKIVSLMLVPFLQGTHRYLYKTSSSVSAKEAGELFAFACAALPFINAVDPAAAELLYDRAWKLNYPKDGTFENIKSAIEATYPRMGLGAGSGMVTCARVGELVDGSLNVLSAACVDSSPPPPPTNPASIESSAVWIKASSCVFLLLSVLFFTI